MRDSLFFLPFVLACTSWTHPVSAGPTPSAWTPSTEARAVYDALSARDPVGCETVEALTKDPVTTLLEVVDHATMPPWVAVRATECLVARHGTEVRERMIGWVQDPQTRGLAEIVYHGLDGLPEDLAVEVATAALSGSDPAAARSHIAKSQLPRIKALAEP